MTNMFQLPSCELVPFKMETHKNQMTKMTTLEMMPFLVSTINMRLQANEVTGESNIKTRNGIQVPNDLLVMTYS